MGKSFRTKKDKEMIQLNAEKAEIEIKKEKIEDAELVKEELKSEITKILRL